MYKIYKYVQRIQLRNASSDRNLHRIASLRGNEDERRKVERIENCESQTMTTASLQRTPAVKRRSLQRTPAGKRRSQAEAGEK